MEQRGGKGEGEKGGEEMKKREEEMPEKVATSHVQITHKVITTIFSYRPPLPIAHFPPPFINRLYKRKEDYIC